MTDTINDTVHDDAQAVERLREIVTDIRIAMVTTEGPDGAMHSRPMYLQEVEANGDLWFVTSSDSPLADQVRDDARVVASFAKGSDHIFAVVRGSATLHQDRGRIAHFWNPAMKAWFPKGPDDPSITLVHVRGEHGDFWDAPGAPARLVRYVTAIVTGTRANGGERVHVDLGDAGTM